jgi:hypothetical protein
LSAAKNVSATTSAAVSASIPRLAAKRSSAATWRR